MNRFVCGCESERGGVGGHGLDWDFCGADDQFVDRVFTVDGYTMGQVSFFGLIDVRGVEMRLTLWHWKTLLSDKVGMMALGILVWNLVLLGIILGFAWAKK
jgi:hypothetical protein